MQWFEALQAFVQVAEQKSFVRAANQLDLTTSKITKLIQWLEHRLKIVLLIRTTRKVTLTEEGEYLFQRASLLLKEWDDLQKTLIDKMQNPQGKINIAAPANLLNINPIMQWLIEFLNSYPSIQLNTRLITSSVSLSQQNIDIMIGVDRYILDTENTIAKRILRFKYGLYASPQYLKTHQKINTPADLKNHNCLLFREEPYWTFSNGQQYVQGNYSADTGVGLFTAALSHVGLIKAPDFMAKEWVEKNRLQPILQKWYGKSDNLSIYYQKLHYQPRKIKLFIDHIIRCASLEK
jgi:DNA-binding transcriptional LysR family regulator